MDATMAGQTPEPPAAHTLDYRGSPPRTPPRWLRALSTLSLAYPFVLLACLYGQWLFAWYCLGHPPIPMVNDPKDVSNSGLLHVMTLVAFAGFVPVGVGALAIQVVLSFFPRFAWKSIALRLALVSVLWAGAYAWLMFDPGRVLEWWLD